MVKVQDVQVVFQKKIKNKKLKKVAAGEIQHIGSSRERPKGLGWCRQALWIILGLMTNG